MSKLTAKIVFENGFHPIRVQSKTLLKLKDEMHFIVRTICLITCLFTIMPAVDAQTPPSATSPEAAAVKTRAFKFTYGAVLENIEPGKHVKVWLPVASTNHDQDVELLQVNVGGEYQETLEARYGNKLIFF